MVYKMPDSSNELQNTLTMSGQIPSNASIHELPKIQICDCDWKKGGEFNNAQIIQ